jgi:hypothetical protein
MMFDPLLLSCQREEFQPPLSSSSNEFSIHVDFPFKTFIQVRLENSLDGAGEMLKDGTKEHLHKVIQ